MAAAKISTELHTTFDEMDSSETTKAYIQMADVDHDAVMAEFARLYPDEYNVYMYAKSDATEKLSEEQEVLLQRAVELKRAVYKQFYTASNREILNMEFEADAQVYVSEYAPMAIVETDQITALRIARSENVEAITTYSDETIQPRIPQLGVVSDALIPHLDLSNQITRADVLRDTYGLTGAGIKIGILEEGTPDTTDEYLQNANIIIKTEDESVSRHATTVTMILAAVAEDGTKHGIVPDATFYCASVSNNEYLYSDVEWMISQGVNIINFSCGRINYFGAEYDEESQWVDHVAAVHDVHFVQAAGNNEEYISIPGMAYNSITVGSLEHNGSDEVANFEMFSDSCYKEDGNNIAEKPNLIANGYFGIFPMPNDDGNYELTPYSGTSFAAPQVTGVIAQLCCWDGNLKFRQSVVGAVLAASAAEKVNAVGNGYKGDQFLTSIPGCEQLHDKEGAGILDARWAWGILANYNYWHLKLVQSDFPYEKTVTINTNLNTISRVAIFWLKDNSIIDHVNDSVSDSNASLANLDLYVYDSEGNLVASSTTLYNNCEIVQFVPTAPGTYTIKIVLVGTTNITEHIGLALW